MLPIRLAGPDDIMRLAVFLADGGHPHGDALRLAGEGDCDTNLVRMALAAAIILLRGRQEDEKC